MSSIIRKMLNKSSNPETPPPSTSSTAGPPRRPSKPDNSPRILVIGAGSRGTTYARAIHSSTIGTIVGIAEPIEFKRDLFVSKYGINKLEGMVFSSWTELTENDEVREKIKRQVDGICICTLDETHAEVVEALRSLNVHILCEKPLSTTLDSCIQIYNTITAPSLPPILLAIGHVLRYSPHNMLLRKLVCEEKVLGEVVNVNHTEPVGWWHFSHSYVRGNWRKTSTSAPSLLTKCCHDIDLLLWLLCSPTTTATPHLPTSVSSSGSLVHFRPSRKPAKAGAATNCFSCPAEPDCIFSAKKIYIERSLYRGNTGWPVKIVMPEIEDVPNLATAVTMLEQRLTEDYVKDEEQIGADGQQKSFYGRCVYEAGNDVVDNQVVTMSWEDDFLPHQSDVGELITAGRGAKTATLTMIAFSEKICERFTRIHGTEGELQADSNTIKVYDFKTEQTKVWRPDLDLQSGHGGGDVGLAAAFVDAIHKVKYEGWSVEKAQKEIIQVTPEEVLRSHAAVFWAEEAREGRKVIMWEDWWKANVSREG